MADLTTAANVLRQLPAGTPMPAHGFDIEIAAASAMVRRFCNRQFDEEERTETHDAGGRIVGLNEYPVSEIDSITFVDDDTNTELVADTDYRLDAATGLVRLTCKPREVWRNIEIVYTAGYATIPADLDLATAIIAAALWEQAQHSAALAGVKREKLGAYEYEMQPASDRGWGAMAVPATAAAILVQFRRTII